MQTFTVDGHEPSLLPEGKNWKLVWSAEFDGTELDRSKWGFRLNFWGKRFHAYTDEGVILDGKSNVEIHLLCKDGQYCSAQLQTGALTYDAPRPVDAGLQRAVVWPFGEMEKPRFMHRYGYYECRCKLQKQRGWWSAFWLQAPSVGSAPNAEYCGIENDIMECFGAPEVTSGNFYDPYVSTIVKRDARVHYNVEGGPDTWHRFGMDWSKDGYVFYCDGRETARSTGPVSRVEQFILLTTECMGYRDGGPSEDLKKAVLPDCFTVDYVRVFDAV